MRFLLVLLVALWPAVGNAQANPLALPLVQVGDLRYLGKFTLPQTDGTGRPQDQGGLTWGGTGLGLGPDGTSLYFGCHDWGKRLARVTIPAVGGVGAVVEPCAPIANLAGINPGDSTSKILGGSFVWNGRTVVSAFAYYDGNGSATASHFVGSTVANQVGPYRVGSMNPGFVGGYMGVVPQEWRALLGGPALTGQCCLAIIGRTSAGPSASVFNPDDVGTLSPVPSTMLVGYPTGHELGAWGAYNPLFHGATQMAGLAFPSGTRSVLFIGRHGATFCYGTGTGNKALEGQPDGQGNRYCYDPVDGSKGVHGYPYHHQVWAYDANDLLAVKQGTKQPWDLRPYGVWTLTDMNNNGAASIRSATYDPATRRIYVTAGSGDGAPTVHVYEVTTAVAPPPPPPPPPPAPAPTATLVANPASVAPGDTAGLCWTTANADSATITPGAGVVTPTAGGCVDVTPSQTTAYTVTAPGAGGTVSVTATVTVVAPPPPPPPPSGFTGVLRAQTSYTVSGLTAGLRLALQVDDQDASTIPALGGAVTMALPMTDGSVDRRACSIWKVEPTGYTTTGARTRVTVQCPGMTGVRVRVER